MLFLQDTTDSCPADSQSSDRSVLWRKRQLKEKPMNDYEVIELAFDMLADSEVMEEFEDSIWLKVDREMYEQFQTAQRPSSTPHQPPESHPSPVGEGDGPLLNSAKETYMHTTGSACSPMSQPMALSTWLKKPVRSGCLTRLPLNCDTNRDIKKTTSQ
jgi:hypothetical protein